MNVWSQYILSIRERWAEDCVITPMCEWAPVPAIVCDDGLTLSVQASTFHYCEPRENDPGDEGWFSFEVLVTEGHEYLTGEDYSDLGVVEVDDPCGWVDHLALNRIWSRHNKESFKLIEG